MIRNKVERIVQRSARIGLGDHNASVSNGRAMMAMLDRPNVWQQIASDPALAATAVEEALRFDGPGQGLLRITTANITIGEVTIPAEARVLPLIGSANRDPCRFHDPDEFRLDRQTNDHLAFGTGIHFCIGNALARIEARVAIEVLARRLPPIARAGAPTRIASPVLRGLRSLPVAIERTEVATSTA